MDFTVNNLVCNTEFLTMEQFVTHHYFYSLKNTCTTLYTSDFSEAIAYFLRFAWGSKQ